MNRRSLIATLALSAALLVTRGSAQPPDEEAPDLSGTWQCAGWNLGTDPKKDPDYRITVEVAKQRGQNNVYLITWNLPDGSKNRGVGLYDPRTKAFAGGYAVGQSPGVGVWSVSKDAKRMECVGTFQQIAQRGLVAYETWTRE
jgi:hypothetical protein